MKVKMVAAIVLSLAVALGGVTVAEAGAEQHLSGGGWVQNDLDNGRVEFSVDIPCNAGSRPATLEVNFGDRHFRLDEITSAQCSNPPEPDRQGGTVEFEGTGHCQGEARGIIIVGGRLTDAGEGEQSSDTGRGGDQASFEVSQRSGYPPDPCRLSVSGPLGGGNLQMVQ